MWHAGICSSKAAKPAGRWSPLSSSAFYNWGEKVFTGARISPQNLTSVLALIFCFNFTPLIKLIEVWRRLKISRLFNKNKAPIRKPLLAWKGARKPPRRRPATPGVVVRLCASGKRRGFWVGGFTPPLMWRPSRLLQWRGSFWDGCSGCKQAWSGTRQWSSGQPGDGRGEGEGPCVLCSPPPASLQFIPKIWLFLGGLHGLGSLWALQAFASPPDLYPCRPEVTWSPVHSSPL